mgnify:CR=1 FL=1
MTVDQENIIKILQNIFPSKEDFQSFKEELKQSNNEVLNSNDKIATELKNLRQEVSFFHIGQKRQDEVLGNHEIRLKTVEVR